MHDTDRDRLAASLRAVRRRLLRHRRLLTAGLAGIAALAAVNLWVPPAPETRAVVVAARDLPSGAVLGGGDLKVAQVATGVVPRGVSASTTALLGRTLAAPVRSGEVITDLRVVGSRLLDGYDEHLVAAPLPVADRQVASLLTVGDRVDVYAATGDVAAPADQIAADAPVLALPDPPELSREGALVVLAVSDPVAARLAQAVATTQVTVVLDNSP